VFLDNALQPIGLSLCRLDSVVPRSARCERALDRCGGEAVRAGGW
jgi:hypothetical protein